MFVNMLYVSIIGKNNLKIRCPGIYYHCVITDFVRFVYLFAFISLFVKLPNNAIGFGFLY